MTQISLLREMIEDFSGRAEFLAIYVQEAHATDGLWVYESNQYEIATHKTMHQRQEAAQDLRSLLPCEIVLDGMDDAASYQYNGYPDRLFIIFNGRIEYVGGVGPFHFSVASLRRKLQNMV